MQQGAGAQSVAARGRLFVAEALRWRRLARRWGIYGNWLSSYIKEHQAAALEDPTLLAWQKKWWARTGSLLRAKKERGRDFLAQVAAEEEAWDENFGLRFEGNEPEQEPEATSTGSASSTQAAPVNIQVHITVNNANATGSNTGGTGGASGNDARGGGRAARGNGRGHGRGTRGRGRR